jgi:hydrogenase/urease accessory protein HupE
MINIGPATIVVLVIGFGLSMLVLSDDETRPILYWLVALVFFVLGCAHGYYNLAEAETDDLLFAALHATR